MNCERPTIVAMLAVASFACAAPRESAPAERVEAPRVEKKLGNYAQEIPGSAFRFEMTAIGGDPSKGIAPFWIGTTELTWEAFDVFVYGLDQPDGAASSGVDATTRPTKPYLPPDRGFGHEGHAALGMSFKNAAAFCAWLSRASGRTYRLPTEVEWEHACRAGATTRYSFGDDPAALAAHAWFVDDAENKTHPVATKQPNAWGLHDMLGNVEEWCVDADGKPVTKGGSYADAAAELECSARSPENPAWNKSDPQIPKSKWWLADGPFVGFRVLCESKP